MRDVDFPIRVPWDSDSSAGAWIADRLGPFGTVGGNIPLGYEIYVRIPNHPMGEENGSSLIQHVRDRPEQVDQLTHLTRVLAPTTTDQICHFAIWTGYGWMYDHGTDPDRATGYAVTVLLGPHSTPEQTDAARQRAAESKHIRMVERPAAPMLRLPHRDYHLWRGSIASARVFAPHHQSPTLWWPADRSWFVASDIDSEFTDVGGPRALLTELLNDPDWRAQQVCPDEPIVMSWESHPHR